jgi:uncharacterized membrane protein
MMNGGEGTIFWDNKLSKMNTIKRSLAKTVTYRLISSAIGFLVVWALSNDIKTGAMFSIAELVYKPLQYYIHERIWQRVKWGKNEE